MKGSSFSMKLKKLISVAAAAVLSAAMFTGCGSKAPENTVFSIDDLNGKKIGVQLGTVGDTYASDVEGATVERYNKGADAVQALKQGKIDAVIIDLQPATVFVSQNSDSLTILDDKYPDENYAIAIKKDNDELTQQINDALAQLESNGTLEQIKSNWIGDEAGQHPYTSPEGIQYDGTMVMATNAEFPPYESMSGEDVVGFDADMMKAVCDILGKDLKIDNMEFDSIIAAVQTGKADVGVAGMTVTEDRLENVNFSDPYTTATQVIIVRK